MPERAAVRIEVRVTPRAPRDAIEGVDADGALRVRIRAAPVEGAANVALCRLLAAGSGVPSSAVTVVRGAAARRKLVQMEGLDAASLAERWPGIRVDGRRAL
jgi:uncharacterized protein YggU (UPF0235/DUF167 family)